MIRHAAFGAALGFALALGVLGGVGATPALAQQEDRVLVIYGNDPCPNSQGQEIVVCARKPEGERFRIPSELRSGGVNNWRERARSLEYAGAGGTQSCTPTGAGGWTGCFGQLMRAAKAERQDKKAQDRAVDNTIGATGTVR